MGSLAKDFRFVIRQGRKSPGFTLTVVLTLALYRCPKLARRLRKSIRLDWSGQPEDGVREIKFGLLDLMGSPLPALLISNET